MNDTNSVIMVGRLTEDAVVRQSAKGNPFITFRLAQNHYNHNSAGEVESEAAFFKVVFFCKKEDEVTSSLTKGRKVHLDGRLGFKKYTAKDGSKREEISILTDKVNLIETEHKEEKTAVSA